MLVFFTIWRERFLRQMPMQKPLYDICHIHRVTFVTLENMVKVVDTCISLSMQQTI
jgi:hypothetical protein